MTKILAAALTAACLTGAGATLAQASAAPTLTIGHPWSLPVPSGAPTAAGYLTITNTGATADRLIGAAVPDVDHVEVHEMTMDGAIMRMRPIPGGLVLPPGKTVTLAPGGYHLMLIGPKRGFKVGDHIPATIRFEHAAPAKVDFQVQLPPKAADASTPMGKH